MIHSNAVAVWAPGGPGTGMIPVCDQVAAAVESECAGCAAATLCRHATRPVRGCAAGWGVLNLGNSTVGETPD